MNELQKMLAGELYRAADHELVQMRVHARELTRHFNSTTETELDRRAGILVELFGAVGLGAFIEPPFHCDYGSHIFAGKDLYMNFGCVILDCAEVHIGDSVMFGPGVQIYTASHPLEAELRVSGAELAKPIRIGNRVWIGGGSILCPGVSIGEDSTIGAGSVVTRDVPARVFAAGNPCRVVRGI